MMPSAPPFLGPSPTQTKSIQAKSQCSAFNTIIPHWEAETAGPKHLSLFPPAFHCGGFNEQE